MIAAPPKTMPARDRRPSSRRRDRAGRTRSLSVWKTPARVEHAVQDADDDQPDEEQRDRQHAARTSGPSTGRCGAAAAGPAAGRGLRRTGRARPVGRPLSASRSARGRTPGGGRTRTLVAGRPAPPMGRRRPTPQRGRRRRPRRRRTGRAGCRWLLGRCRTGAGRPGRVRPGAALSGRSVRPVVAALGAGGPAAGVRRVRRRAAGARRGRTSPSRSDLWPLTSYSCSSGSSALRATATTFDALGQVHEPTPMVCRCARRTS